MPDRRRVYDEFGRTRPADVFAMCQRCHRSITYGQAYMPRIPFLGAWRGFDHQYCPPTLVVSNLGRNRR